MCFSRGNSEFETLQLFLLSSPDTLCSCHIIEFLGAGIEASRSPFVLQFLLHIAMIYLNFFKEWKVERNDSTSLHKFEIIEVTAVLQLHVGSRQGVR